MFEAEITYNPQMPKGGIMKSLKNKFWSSSSSAKPLTDTIAISIYQPSKNGERHILSSGSGSWLSHIEFDGKLFWKLDEPYEKWRLPNEIGDSEYLLESDSSRRGDMKYLIEKNFEMAEKTKHEMEEVQRKDKKARLAAKTKRE